MSNSRLLLHQDNPPTPLHHFTALRQIQGLRFPEHHPGTKRRQYLEENIRSVEVELSAAELKEIGEKLPVGMTAGDRYPAEAMKAVNR